MSNTIPMLKRKPSYFNWTVAEWREYYYETLRTATDTYADGRVVTFDQRTLNLPSLIVNTWSRTVFSNNLVATEVGSEEVSNYLYDNKLLVGEDNGYPSYIDLKTIFESTIAYGSILVDYNEEGQPVMIHSYLKMYNASNKFVGYRYFRKVNGVRQKVVHTIAEGKYVKIIDDDTVWENPDYMMAFESENILSLDDGATLPIYAYALPAIEEANDAYNELANERVLSRKMVLIPRVMDDTNRSKLSDKQNQVPIIDKNNRLIKVYDTKDEKNTPTYVSGGFEPTANIEDINFHLKVVGLQAGLGSKRYSMDNTGQIKTAEEVRADNTEYIISETNIIGEVLGRLVSNLLTRAFGRVIVVEVTGSKDELESVPDRDKRLLQEYQAGLIERTDYHRLRGMDEEEIKALDVMDASKNDEYTKYMNGDQNVPSS